MTNGGTVRRRSLAVPIILIGLGVLFLYANWRPEFDPWPVIWRYWPLLLIFVGLGKMWDSIRNRQSQGTSSGISMGSTFAVLGFVVVLGLLIWHGHGSGRSFFHGTRHETQTVDRQGAQSVHVKIDMPAGELKISGGADRLLEADFTYSGSMGTPRVDYNVSGGSGELSVNQNEGRGVHFGRSENDWNLRLSNNVPLAMELNMGAGKGTLRMQGLNLTSLQVHMGAGELTLDLTGERKSDLRAEIKGGVGEANIRLPKDVGVKVHAKGGIGSIDTHGLRRNGDEYVNDVYGKSPVTIRLDVEGGIGTINLRQEP